VAPDKFRGSITASTLARGISSHLRQHHVDAKPFPLSDGGEGFLDAFSGDSIEVDLLGPLGEPTSAKALLLRKPDGVVGIVESAEAIGRQLVKQPTSAEALAASSAPLGALLLACREAGATELLIGLGGSATSDGGQGVFHVLNAQAFDLPMTIACDVEVPYFEAMAFAEQKGIATNDLEKVRARLSDMATFLQEATGTDPRTLLGAGTAGGVGGALLCLGAQSVSGAQLVADQCGLTQALASATTLITGEGALDATSLSGKVVGHLLTSAPPDCQVIIVAGTATREVLNEIERRRPGTEVLILDQQFGTARSLADPLPLATSLLDQLLLLDATS
jgi:glycerate kinase